MSIVANVNAVSDDIVFCLDPLNFKSYSSAGNFIASPYNLNAPGSTSGFGIWYKEANNPTTIPNAAVAPDGSTTATWVANSGTTSLITQLVPISVSGTGVQVCSIFAKAGTTSTFTFNCYYSNSVSSETNITFYLVGDGQTDAPTKSFIKPYKDGWYLCVIVIPANVDGGFFLYRLWPHIRGVIDNSFGLYFWEALARPAINDSAGKYNAAIYGGDTILNNTEKALVFDGVDDYLTTITDSTSMGNGITMSAWIKTTASGVRVLISKGLKTTGHWELWLNNGELCIYLFDVDSYSSEVVVADGQWKNVVATYDNFDIKFYVNGVRVSTISVTGNIEPMTATIDIGRSEQDGLYYSGNIAEARVYSRALSDEEILQNYKELNKRFIVPERISTVGLVGNYDSSKYNPGTTQWIPDYGPSGTLAGGVGYSYQNDGALVFDGTDDYVSLTSPAIASGGTILMWVESTVLNRDLFNSQSGGFNQLTLSADERFFNTGRLDFRVAGGTYNGDVGVDSNLVFDGTPRMVAATWQSGGETALWVDGVKLARQSNTTSTLVLGSDFQIGTKDWATERKFQGRIYNTSIYNRILRGSEIRDYFNLTRGRLGRESVDNSLVVSFDADSTAVLGYSSGTTWFDQAGNHDATLVGGVSYTSDDGGALVFDGVNDYITTPITETFQNFTLSCWFYNKSSTIPFRALISKNSYFASTEDDWPVKLQLNAEGTFVSIRITSGTSYFVTDPSTGSEISAPLDTLNKWYHVTATYDKSNLKIYVNGILRNSTPNNISLPNNTQRVWTIGRDSVELSGGVGNSSYDGKIGKVLIYDRALTRQEVKSLFNSTKSRFGL